ncbi:hypothetical protein GGR51DRAFT_505419 [Nemania sp. FL0031]|nr:hypothetical protein GGR51DRAFT_505419 [Nemania sp. FL0031]
MQPDSWGRNRYYKYELCDLTTSFLFIIDISPLACLNFHSISHKNSHKMFCTQKLGLILCLALTSMARPKGHSSAIRAQSDTGDPNILVQPTMYQVFPFDASKSVPTVPQLEVLRTDDVSTLENIAVFAGIPADAKTCVLGWVQAAKEERTDFVVKGNGLLAAQQLSRFPDGNVSWEAIVPIAEEAVQQGRPLLHPDTTSWPQIETAESHIAGYVNCAETIYFKIQVDYRDHDGSVYLGQDAKNGLTLQIQ